MYYFKSSIKGEEDYNKTMIQDAIHSKINNSTNLEDVGGLFEVKKEVTDFAEIILNPQKYMELEKLC